MGDLLLKQSQIIFGFYIPPTCGRYPDGLDILSPKQEKKRCAREFQNKLCSNIIELRSTKTMIILLKMAMILNHVKWERCNVIVKWEINTSCNSLSYLNPPS